VLCDFKFQSAQTSTCFYALDNVDHYGVMLFEFVLAERGFWKFGASLSDRDAPINSYECNNSDRHMFSSECSVVFARNFAALWSEAL